METEQNDDLISKCINFLNSQGYEAKEQIEEVFQMILDSDVNQLKPVFNKSMQITIKNPRQPAYCHIYLLLEATAISKSNFEFFIAVKTKVAAESLLCPTITTC